MRWLELITHGSPRGSTAILTAPPGTEAHPAPVQFQMPKPPNAPFVPITHADPFAPTPTSIADPGNRSQPAPVQRKICRAELTTHGRPAGSTAILTAPPGTAA